MDDLGISGIFPHSFFVLYQSLNASRLHVCTSRSSALCFPFTSYTWFACVVRVVGISVKSYTWVVCKTQSEQACQIAPCQSIAGSHIRNPTDGVLPFQIHIYHEWKFLFVSLLGNIAVFVLLVIDFYLVHHIGREVFESYAWVASEEIFAVYKQTADILAANTYLPSSQFEAWKSFDKSVEHGSLC